MKVVFMGTPVFAVPILQALAKNHEVVCVYTQPPRPAGKGYKLVSSPIQEAAEKLGIPVRCPFSLKKEEEQIPFMALEADVGVVCAYGLILPSAVLEAPKLGCINVHASLLPRWRGASPIQRAIEAGDKQTGITIMQMDVGLDTGSMLLKKTVQIDEDTTAGKLHDALSALGAQMIIQVLNENPVPTPQPDAGITYAEKIQKQEALIDWMLPALHIKHKIMAFNPYPGAYLMFKGERIKVFDAEIVRESHQTKPGTILDDNLLIACGKGTCLRLTVLQRSGKKKLPAEEFLKGFIIPKGENVAL